MIWLVVLTVVNAAYVAALPSATIFYVANVLLHPVLAGATVAWLLLKKRPPQAGRALPLLLAALIGLWLVRYGATTNHFTVLWAHIAFGIVGLALLLPQWRWISGLAALTLVASVIRYEAPKARIRNPYTPPLSMTDEGAGPKSPFWPSSANTNTGGFPPGEAYHSGHLRANSMLAAT